jgi:adenylate kinase
MLNIVLFGPPGAGKGTQSARLTGKYNLVHLSTGDIFRFNMKNDTDLGRLAKSYIDKGELVPDEVTINMLQAEADKINDPNGFIFDGFPRTIPQAEALDRFLESRSTSITLMVALDVPEEELVKRLILRGKESGRSDDSDENVVRNRIAVYNEQTAVAANYYAAQGKFHKVDGVGSIDDIFDRLCHVIDTHSLLA